MTNNRYNSGRKKDAAPLEEAFNELLKAYRLKDKFDERLLMQAWPEMMGKTVATRTSGLYIKDKKLFVKITSGPVKSELNMNRTKVLDLIASKFGKGIIEELVIL
jgi:predicted nucleic acid-binding Zn ribbon protein